MELAGKVALVTGSAVRVGRAIVLELARCGADVLIHYRRSARQAERTADDVRAAGRRAGTVAADLASTDEAVRTLIGAAEQQFGRLDLLVNNGSVYLPGTPADLPPARWAEMFAVNAVSPAALAQAAAERMARDGGGAIVNILDIQALRPWPRFLAYGMTKAALWAATVGLARSAAPAVRVNGVAPGVAMWNEQNDPAFRERLVAQIPLGRPGTPEDIARAVRFLFENDYITGEVICVDGGKSMG